MRVLDWKKSNLNMAFVNWRSSKNISSGIYWIIAPKGIFFRKVLPFLTDFWWNFYDDLTDMIRIYEIPKSMRPTRDLFSNFSFENKFIDLFLTILICILFICIRKVSTVLSLSILKTYKTQSWQDANAAVISSLADCP